MCMGLEFKPRAADGPTKSTTTTLFFFLFLYAADNFSFFQETFTVVTLGRIQAVSLSKKVGLVFVYNGQTRFSKSTFSISN